MENKKFLIKFVFLSIFFCCSFCVPERGKWDFTIHGNSDQGYQTAVISKSLFSGGKFVVKITCDGQSEPGDLMLDVIWYLRKVNCWKEHYENGPTSLLPTVAFKELEKYGKDLGTNLTSESVNAEEKCLCDSKGFYLKSEQKKLHISNDLMTDEVAQESATTMAPQSTESIESPVQKRETKSEENALSKSGSTSPPSLFIVDADGIYQFILGLNAPIRPLGHNGTFVAQIHIEVYSDYGYLSAADYPLLIFYSTMCVIYVLYGIAWLIVSFMQWRELLRVQYWIGGVILLGMLEKAVFTAEYERVNETGNAKLSLIIFAEIVSCAKRSLSRMLVIIVSLGFGIVKPRLGVVLNRVVAVGLIYFTLASVEACLRAIRPNFSNAEDIKALYFATIPLALLESAICWWVFSALVNTTRTLRLRRNTAKLSLYRHFTNTLAFAVFTSVIFMLWSIKYLNLNICLSDWKQLWVNDAFWHILFAIILLVIMILWRPTNNNQRFAYTPLLDGIEGDDEEEENLMADISDTMKLRNTRNSTSSSPRESHSVEDDLKWLDENIPSSLADSALPVMDSEEEIVNTKFEISKMQ